MTDTMNLEKWIDALRSGKFKQTRDKLKSRNGAFCCLGVACELAGVPSTYDGGGYVYGDLDGDYLNEEYSESGLPKAAQEWLGVNEGDPYVNITDPDSKYVTSSSIEPHYSRPTCAVLNDEFKLSFEQIADLVEEYGLTDERVLRVDA